MSNERHHDASKGKAVGLGGPELVDRMMFSSLLEASDDCSCRRSITGKTITSTSSSTSSDPDQNNPPKAPQAGLTMEDRIGYYLKDYPQVIKQRLPGRSAMLPLHEACSKICTLPVLQRIYDAFPDAVKLPDGEGDLPLHITCALSDEPVSLKQFWSSLCFLLDAYPQARTHSNQFGRTPLNILCYGGYCPPTYILNKLVDGCEHTLLQKDRHGSVPLGRCGRRAYLSGLSSQIRDKLLNYAQSAPASVFVDIIMSHSSHAGFLEDLYEQTFRWLDRMVPRSGLSPMSSAAKTVQKSPWSDGTTPLHILCHQKLSQYTVQAILQVLSKLPQTISIQDANGRTPLHYLSKDSVMVNSSEVNSSQRAEGLQHDGITDELSEPSWYIPRLDLDMTHGDLIRTMLDAYPRAISIGDRSGMTPLLLAASQKEANMNVVYLLLLQDPSLLCCSTMDTASLVQPGKKRPASSAVDKEGQSVTTGSKKQKNTDMT